MIGAHATDDLLVSVVIPVLNDVPALEAQLSTLDRSPACEVIVVDGGTEDEDGMRRLRSRFGDVRWQQSPPGRARQMNEGAGRARGTWLLFLHADTRLTAGWLEELRRADADPQTIGGSFSFRLDSGARWARWIERGVSVRVHLFGLSYGDQALFVRREVFHAMQGYRDIPLMEDVDFARRLRRMGRILRSTMAAVTSARRWEQEGWLRRSASNVVLVLLFLAGVPPVRLARLYRPRPDRRASVPDE